MSKNRNFSLLNYFKIINNGFRLNKNKSFHVNTLDAVIVFISGFACVYVCINYVQIQLWYKHLYYKHIYMQVENLYYEKYLKYKNKYVNLQNQNVVFLITSTK